MFLCKFECRRAFCLELRQNIFVKGITHDPALTKRTPKSVLFDIQSVSKKGCQVCTSVYMMSVPVDYDNEAISNERNLSVYWHIYFSLHCYFVLHLHGIEILAVYRKFKTFFSSSAVSHSDFGAPSAHSIFA